MKKRTEGEPRQKQKSFNSKIWIRMISTVLCVAALSVICFGMVSCTSDDTIAALQANLNSANAELEALKAEKDLLQGDLALNHEALEQLTAELAAVQEALEQAKKLQESLEDSLAKLERANQSAQEEIDQLKSDAETAQGEIASLKEQLEAQQKEPEDKIRIYVDQGHNPTSYHNSGASGNGLYEQDVTFLVGCILADLLKADGRFEVQLSRPNKSVVLGTDNDSSRMARVEGAAAFEADYLISLHTNSYDQNTANGIEIYVAEAASESYVFGNTLLEGLIESTGLRDRGMKLNPDLDLLKYSTMPAVLVEMGFISNPTDAALMSEHPELFAKGIYNGILEYFGFLPSASAAA